MRDADGNWAAIIEFVPVTNVLVYERFVTLARVLYQKWVVESPRVKNETVAPSDTMAQASASTPTRVAHCPARKPLLTTTDKSGHVG